LRAAARSTLVFTNISYEHHFSLILVYGKGNDDCLPSVHEDCDRSTTFNFGGFLSPGGWAARPLSMNLTLVALIQATSLLSSPFLAVASRVSPGRVALDRLRASRFAAPIIQSAAALTDYRLASSHFSKFLSQVAHLSGFKGELVREQKILSDVFKIEIYQCVFSEVKTSITCGAAFYASSDIHTLHVRESVFIKCRSEHTDRVGNRLNQVGGGAFVFSGSRSVIESSYFVRCRAASNTQTLHTYILHLGLNRVLRCYFARNGGADTTGHTLFSIDNGAAELNSVNITHNYVTGGYAGGHIGWFASPAKILYGHFEHNVGKSIFGACAYVPDHPGTEVNTVLFADNYATKYGIYMRHTGTTTIRGAVFVKNTGQAFYGNAPLSLHHSFFDCDRPEGPIEENTVAWNYKAGKPLKLKVPAGIPESPLVSASEIDQLLVVREDDVESTFEELKKRKTEERHIKKIVAKAQAKPKLSTRSLGDILKNHTERVKPDAPRPVRINKTRKILDDRKRFLGPGQAAPGDKKPVVDDRARFRGPNEAVPGAKKPVVDDRARFRGPNEAAPEVKKPVVDDRARFRRPNEAASEVKKPVVDDRARFRGPNEPAPVAKPAVAAPVVPKAAPEGEARPKVAPVPAR
jgi:hypothetical protein